MVAAPRFIPVLLISGVLSTAVLTGSLSGSLAAFTASIAHSGTGSAAATDGRVILSETGPNGGATVCTSTDGGSVATNSSTCTTINEFASASAILPGAAPAATTVTMTNGGSAAGALTVKGGGCTQSGAVSGSATDLCNQLSVVISVTAGGSTVTLPAQTLAALTASNPLNLGTLASNGSALVSFAVTLPAAAGNAYQGLTATVPLTWTLTA